MRHFMALALSFGIAASSSAQTQGEIIVRRPGVPDRVIRLDSGAVKQELANLEGKLREMTITSHLRDKEVEGRVRELQNTMKRSVEGLQTATLAIKEGAITSHMMPMLRNLEISLRRPIIGISIDVEPRETDKVGAYIQAVTPGSPAERAGILSGDLVVRVAGKSVVEKTAKDDSGPGVRLISILSALPVGKPVDIELRRGTKTLNLKVTPIEENIGGAIARTSAPSIARMGTVQSDRMTGDISVRTVPATPQGMSLFATPSGNFTYNFVNNGLFSNIELTALNEKLGSYFGATEGVLVVNVDAPRDMMMMTGGMAGGGRGGAVAGTLGGARAGRIIDTAFTIRRNGNVDSLTRKIDTIALPRDAAGRVTVRSGRAEPSATYIDGVPVQRVKIPVEPGDVIVSVDGRKVSSPSRLMRIVGSYEHNDEFKLQIIRQKRAETLTVKVP